MVLADTGGPFRYRTETNDLDPRNTGRRGAVNRCVFRTPDLACTIASAQTSQKPGRSSSPHRAFCRKLAMSCENPTISRFSSIVGEDRFCIRVTGIDGESQYVGFDNK